MKKIEKICIICPFYNQPEYTLKFIECCCQLSPRKGQTIDILMVDNGSNHETLNKLDKFFVRCRGVRNHFKFIRNEKNLMFGEGVNGALAKTLNFHKFGEHEFFTSEYDAYAILNNDIVFTAEGFNRCIDALSDYDIVGPYTNACAGYQSEQGPTPNIDANLLSTEELYLKIREVESEMIVHPIDYYFTSINEELGGPFYPSDELMWINGFAMFLRSSAVLPLIHTFGVFFDHKTFPLSGEEIDMCYKAKMLGLELGITQAFFWHFKHVTVKDLKDGDKYWKDSAKQMKLRYPKFFPKQFGTTKELLNAVCKTRHS